MRRFIRDRPILQSLARSIDNPIVVPASWVVSGAFFGMATALILQKSLPVIIFAAVVAGALSWLARGVANLVLACIAMLVLVAAAFQAWNTFFPQPVWSLSWLGPCAVVGLILLLWLGRRLLPQQVFSRTGALVELVAAFASLLIAVRFAMRVSAAGSGNASVFLLGWEDNDAWINLVATLRGAHDSTVLSGSSFGVFGSLVPTYLAGVRAASSSFLSTALPLPASPKVVVSAFGLLIASAPIVVVLPLRRMLSLRRPLATLLVWACATALVVSACIVSMGYGSLSSLLVILLLLAAAYLVLTRPRLQDGRSQIAWLGATLLMFGAGSAWIGLVPFAGAAIAVFCLPVLAFVGLNVRRSFRRTTLVAAAFLLAAFLMEQGLLQQFHSVVSDPNPISGVNALLVAQGRFPGVTDAMQALMLVLLLAIVSSPSRARPDGSLPQRSFLTPLLWIAGYVVVLLLMTARTTGTAPGYGPTKLQYLLAAVWISLAVIEVVSRLEGGRGQLGVVAAIVLAVLWVGTVQTGPVYDATTRHWPFPRPKPVWLDAVQREAASGDRVLCLSSDLPSMDAYLCSRYVSSLQGKDDGTALTWRFVALARGSVSEDVSLVKKAKDKPWRIVFIGQAAQLRDRKAWWAPIAKLPGLRFVPVSG